MTFEQLSKKLKANTRLLRILGEELEDFKKAIEDIKTIYKGTEQGIKDRFIILKLSIDEINEEEFEKNKDLIKQVLKNNFNLSDSKEFFNSENIENIMYKQLKTTTKTIKILKELEENYNKLLELKVEEIKEAVEQRKGILNKLDKVLEDDPKKKKQMEEFFEEIPSILKIYEM